MKDRLDVYESLVELCLGDPARPDAAEESFSYMEIAKSRNLAELLVRDEPAAPPESAVGQSGLVRRIRDMREELNWYYRRIEQEQLRAEQPSVEKIDKLQREALQHENELLRVLREITSAESGEDANGIPPANPLEAARRLPPARSGARRILRIRENFVAAILTREALEIVPVTPVSRVSNLMRLFAFSDLEIPARADYVRSFEKSLMAAAQSHLGELYTELVAPLRERFCADI